MAQVEAGAEVFESSGREIAYTGLASARNKGDERSFSKGKKFRPVLPRQLPRRQGNPVCPRMNMHGTGRIRNIGVVLNATRKDTRK